MVFVAIDFAVKLVFTFDFAFRRTILVVDKFLTILEHFTTSLIISEFSKLALFTVGSSLDRLMKTGIMSWMTDMNYITFSHVWFDVWPECSMMEHILCKKLVDVCKLGISRSNESEYLRGGQLPIYCTV